MYCRYTSPGNGTLSLAQCSMARNVVTKSLSSMRRNTSSHFVMRWTGAIIEKPVSISSIGTFP